MKHFSRSRLFIINILMLVFLAFSCKKETITVDHKFKNLFYADSNGIICADGIFSVPLPDGSSVFFVGDCFVGKIRDGKLDRKMPMLRNAFNLIDKSRNHATPVIRGTLDNPLTLMEPPKEPDDTLYRWYWPGHGFVTGDTLHVFAFSLYNDPSAHVQLSKPENEKDELDKMAEEMFSFRIAGIDLLSFKLPGFEHLETHRVEFDYQQNPIDFGNCVLSDGDYVYIYGTKNLPCLSQIHVARVPFNSKTFHKGWEYYTETGWDSHIEKSASLETDISISQQFSIFKYRNTYILLTMERSGRDIYTYVSGTPYGHFTGKKLLYHAPEPEADTTKRLFAYNALAHPQYLEHDELLVSYCLNSFHVRDVYNNVENYRARFIRVPVSLIISE